MSDSLDDKLREMLTHWVDEEFIDRNIDKLKQAFADEGYTQFSGGVFGPAKNKMIGQEFYDRFEKEFWAALLETLPEDTKVTIHDISYLDDFAADDILDLAKKAAGLE